MSTETFIGVAEERGGIRQGRGSPPEQWIEDSIL